MRGKKSRPGIGGPSHAAVSVRVSPRPTTTEPWACLAILPVSRYSFWPPIWVSTRQKCTDNLVCNRQEIRLANLFLVLRFSSLAFAEEPRTKSQERLVIYADPAC